MSLELNQKLNKKESNEILDKLIKILHIFGINE
jgi:hypothetical protein